MEVKAALTLCLTGTIVTTASGQLINGSFEADGQFSASGWLYTCLPAEQESGGAPGAGLWHAAVVVGSTPDCLPNYLYQPIPNSVDGGTYSLTGWIRCGTNQPCGGGLLGIASIGPDGVNIIGQTGAESWEWAFVQLTATVSVESGQEPAVVLSAGHMAGPGTLNPAHFDGIQLDLATGIMSQSSTSIHHYVDQVQNTLAISAGEDHITGLMLFDLTGRGLPVNLRHSGGLTVQVDLSALPGGVYFAHVRTKDAERTIRFTTW